MKGRLLCFIMLTTLTVNGQSVSFEAVAYEYFLNKVVPIEYPNGVKFAFHGKTDKGFSTFGLIDNCFDESDTDFKVKLDSVAFNSGRYSTERLNLSSKRSSIVRRFSRTRLSLYKATQLNDLVYVEIVLSTKHQGQDSYILEINKSGEVVRYCKSSLIY